MGYYIRAQLYMSADSPHYFAASSALNHAGANVEVKTLGELRRRLDSAAISAPLGTIVRTERVYRMTRGYEPDKPRSGSTDQEAILELVDKGAFYDPKTGKSRPPRWSKITREQAFGTSRDRRRRR